MMREAAFVKANLNKWKEFEALLTGQEVTEPDKLAALFIQVTDDLSFAKTKYPESKTTTYLNTLASKVYLEIYKNKKEDKGRFITFWTKEVPLLFKSVHPKLGYAFLVFALSIIIGAFSQSVDKDFARLILGDGYINLTLENIEKGKPFGIYGQSEETDMFFRITFNNVKVSFMVFVMGIFISIGSALLLFFNGIMVGTFFTFLGQQGYMGKALTVVMLHGTLELSAIVIAGAAGFVLGNSIIFPGTYSRLDSFKMGAVKGLKIIVGLIPVFIIAGFIESFITRYEDMPLVMKLVIIGLSSAFILYYYIIYPIQIHQQQHAEPLHPLPAGQGL